MRGTADGLDVLHDLAALVSCLALVHFASKEGKDFYPTHFSPKAALLPTVQRQLSCTAPKVCPTIPYIKTA